MLVAGGSGIVPLMAMIRTRAAAGDDTETRLLYSSRSQDDVIYRDELERLSGNGLTVVHALTDSQPPGWTSYARRVDAEMLAEVSPSPAERPRLACDEDWCRILSVMAYGDLMLAAISGCRGIAAGGGVASRGSAASPALAARVGRRVRVAAPVIRGRRRSRSS
jgi:hypothetical protein